MRQLTKAKIKTLCDTFATEAWAHLTAHPDVPSLSYPIPLEAMLVPLMHAADGKLDIHLYANQNPGRDVWCFMLAKW